MITFASGAKTELGSEFTTACGQICDSKEVVRLHATAGAIDSQSVKTTAFPSIRGFVAPAAPLGS